MVWRGHSCPRASSSNVPVKVLLRAVMVLKLVAKKFLIVIPSEARNLLSAASSISKTVGDRYSLHNRGRTALQRRVKRHNKCGL